MINFNSFDHTYNVNYYHSHCSNQRIIIIFFFILFFNWIIYIFNWSKKNYRNHQTYHDYNFKTLHLFQV